MLFAAVLGYFMIYGRISDIYLSVITLVVTLIFEKTIRSTSGDRIRHRQRPPQRTERHSRRAVLQLPGTAGALSIDGVFYFPVGADARSSMSGSACCC